MNWVEEWRKRDPYLIDTEGFLQFIKQKEIEEIERPLRQGVDSYGEPELELVKMSNDLIFTKYCRKCNGYTKHKIKDLVGFKCLEHNK